MRLADPIFDETGDYTARRHMTISGVTFNQGEYIPKIFIPAHKFRVWVDTRTIVLDRTGEARRRYEAAVKSGEVQEKQPLVSSAPEADQPSKAAPVSKAMVAEIPEDAKQSGCIQLNARGWCNVYFGGNLEKVRGEGAALENLKAKMKADGIRDEILFFDSAGARLEDYEPKDSGNSSGTPQSGNEGANENDGEDGASSSAGEAVEEMETVAPLVNAASDDETEATGYVEGILPEPEAVAEGVSSEEAAA